MSSPANSISFPWTVPAAPNTTSPWGSAAGSEPTPCSLQDVMSEELAKELHIKEETKVGMASDAVGGSSDFNISACLVGDEDPEVLKDFLRTQNIQSQVDTANETVDDDLLLAQKLHAKLNAGQPVEVVEKEDSDLLLAQMLQHEFDREHDELLRREESKLNGTSKVTLNFTHYRSVHPALVESDESEDEKDYLWEEKPEKDTMPQFRRSTGISGKGKNIVTKHDSTICGRKNAGRAMDRFAPEIETGDGCGIDMKLSNKVYNQMKMHSEAVEKRSKRLHEKKDHSTADMAVDQKTRLILYKMVNNEVLENVNGIIAAGKESVVFHADGGSMTTELVPKECAIKVFKTTLNDFRNRADYMKGDYRFIKENAEFRKLNPRIIIKMWAQKEEHNLRRLEMANVPCPHVVMLRKHVLLMQFIGNNQHAAPKLKEAKLSTVEMQIAYEQTLDIMKKIYNDAGLVHGDFSEYNLLWHDGQVVVIDVSQAVERRHPQASEFLLRDCRNISAFFKRNGVPNVPDKYKLFNAITGLDLNEEDETLFLKKLQSFEKNEEKLRMDKGKEYPFNHFFDEAKKERNTQRLLDERLGQPSDSDDSDEGESNTDKQVTRCGESIICEAPDVTVGAKSHKRGRSQQPSPFVSSPMSDKFEQKSTSPTVRFKDDIESYD